MSPVASEVGPGRLVPVDDDHDTLVGNAGRDLYFGDNNPADHVTDSISLQALQDQLSVERYPVEPAKAADQPDEVLAGCCLARPGREERQQGSQERFLLGPVGVSQLSSIEFLWRDKQIAQISRIPPEFRTEHLTPVTIGSWIRWQYVLDVPAGAEVVVKLRLVAEDESFLWSISSLGEAELCHEERPVAAQSSFPPALSISPK
jgi:hypothetical protein